MAAEHIEELVKQVARSGVEMASKCGTLEQLRTEFKSLQRCLELGEADDVARSRAEAAAFDLWVRTTYYHFIKPGCL